MTAKDYIELKQKKWAKKEAITLVNKDRYTEKYKDNLFKRTLNENIFKQFKQASGNEIKEDGICNMAAVYSSSALCVNVFQYFYLLWKKKNQKETEKILYALEVLTQDEDIKIEEITFEHKFEIPNISKNYPPNIDVVIKTKDKIFAIESKFREPYYYTPTNKIQEAYYNENIWPDCLLKTKKYINTEDNYDKVEEKRKNGTYKEVNKLNKFKRLDAAQLIKHLLGLYNNKKEKEVHLIYIYYDVPGNMGEEHRKEIKDFSEIIDDNIKFTAISYQELIYNLNNLLDRRNKEHKKYLDYINSRYL